MLLIGTYFNRMMDKYCVNEARILTIWRRSRKFVMSCGYILLKIVLIVIIIYCLMTDSLWSIVMFSAIVSIENSMWRS